MKAVNTSEVSERSKKFSKPADELRIAVTFRRPHDRLGPTKAPARLSSASVMSFVPDPLAIDQALYELHRRGFKTTTRGRLTVSIRGPRSLFEKVFGTQLATFKVDKKQDYAFHAFYFPPKDAPWSPDPAIANLIDDAYIQWPHIYMAERETPRSRRRPRPRPGGAGVSAKPPLVDYFHLEMPLDVPNLLNVTPIHRAGSTGRASVLP